MARHCVLNVDDLGISRGVNHGIAEAHRAGIVTSASLMVDGVAAEEAAELAAGLPELSVGLHTVLTTEGGDPLLNLGDADACRRALDAQLLRFETLMGTTPTHLDSHHHVHRRLRSRPVFRAVATELDIPLRDEPPVSWEGSFYGAWDGESHPEQISFESLTAILGRLDEGVTELACHAGRVDPTLHSSYRDEREIELTTLLDARLPGVVETLGITLISYHDRHLVAPRP